MPGRNAWSLVLPLAAVAAAIGTPRPATASLPDPCAGSNRWWNFELVTSIVAPDGVLRFEGYRNGSASTIEALAFVDVTVVDLSWVPVEGSLEYQAQHQAIVWRPAEPLDPSYAYDVIVEVDNDALGAALDNNLWEGCVPNLQDYSYVLVNSTPLPPLYLPEPIVESSHLVGPDIDLNTLVCCDGAYPYYDLQGGIDVPPTVVWDEGLCASTTAQGWIRANAQLSMDDLTAAMANDLALRLEQTDGPQVTHAGSGSLSVWMEDDEPFCARLRVTSLTTGETLPGPTLCHGDEVADQLGLHTIDPRPELAACMGDPYVCESNGGWDPNQCMPWVYEPEPETGESSGGSGSADEGTSTGGGLGGDDESNGTTGGSAESSDAPQADEVSASGCGCQTPGAPPSGPAWLALAIVGLGVAPRRGRSTRSETTPRRSPRTRVPWA